MVDRTPVLPHFEVRPRLLAGDAPPAAVVLIALDLAINRALASPSRLASLDDDVHAASIVLIALLLAVSRALASPSRLAGHSLVTRTRPPSYSSRSPLRLPDRSHVSSSTTALAWLASTAYDSLPVKVHPDATTLQPAPTHSAEPVFAPVDTHACTRTCEQTE